MSEVNAAALTVQIVDNAKQAVDDYITTTNSLVQDLTDAINNLTAQQFTGDASEGFKAFYTEKILPAITENLSTSESSVMAGIKKIMDSISQNLISTVDPGLGDANRNPSAS